MGNDNEWTVDNESPQFTAEQTLIWLDSWREFMFEVWKNNPDLRKRWEEINSAEEKSGRH